jgi:ferredoxin-nitrate reductase
MVNSERRVTHCPAFRPPPGQARPDWQVFAEVGRRLGFERQFAYSSAADVYAEFVALTAGRVCDSSGLSHDLLRELGPQQWPYPRGERPGGASKRLYLDRVFPTPDGRARFQADAPLGLAESPCESYPLVLTVGRYLGQWHTMTRTGKVPRLQAMDPEALLEIHPDDAVVSGVEDGAFAAITSRRGSVTARVKVSDRIRPGTVFLPMHWGSAQENACAVNTLLHEQACPLSGQPELKAAAVWVAAADSAVRPREQSGEASGWSIWPLLRSGRTDGPARAQGRADQPSGVG